MGELRPIEAVTGRFHKQMRKSTGLKARHYKGKKQIPCCARDDNVVRAG